MRKLAAVLGAVIIVMVAVFVTVTGYHVGNYVGRGFDYGTAIKWTMDDVWKPIFKTVTQKAEENPSYPFANQNIDWNWQKSAR